RRRHATHFLELAEAIRSTWNVAQEAAARRRLDRDHDNLRAALRWAEVGGDPGLAARLAAALEWLDRVLLDRFQGKAAADDYERLLASARQTGDKPGEMRALLGLVRAYYVLALDDQTGKAIERSRECFETGSVLA